LAGTRAAGIAACAVEKMTSWRERVICQDFNEQCDYERLVKYEFSLRVASCSHGLLMLCAAFSSTGAMCAALLSMLTSKRLHVFIRSCKCLASSRETSSGSILGACWSFTTCKYWELAHVRPLSEQKRSYTSDAMRWIHPEADGKPRSHAHAAAYQSFQARGRSSCCQR
jgi:hypothetical protein